MTVNAVGSQTLGSPVLAGGITNSDIGIATARPYSLATQDVDAGLTYEAINRKLQIESTLGEVFLDIGSDIVFTGKKVPLPDACIMRISSEKGARSQVMPLENPLTGPGRAGTTEKQQGYERSTTLQYMKVFYNEYSQGVIGEKWGMNYNDLQIFNFYAGLQPRLSRWFAEDEGRQYREALLETVSWVLTKDGTNISKSYNPNIFVANTEFADQPEYDSVAATYRGNINTACDAAATGTAGVNANIDLDQLVYIDYYAQNYKRIKPVMIGGKASYVLLLPSNQYRELLRISDGKLGSVWENVTQLSDEEQNFPGIVGRVMSLVIVEDQRYPTITIAENGTHTVEYVNPGNDDSRNKAAYGASNKSWDVASLMGAGAIVDWSVTPLHFEMEQTEYGKVYGKAAFAERGIQLGCTYDTDTATNNNIKNFGSIEVLFSASSVVKTA